MKYIIFENVNTDEKIPVVFPDVLVHADVSRGIERAAMTSRYHPVSLFPVSAGFVFVRNGEKGLSVTCSGKSESLNLSSQPEDADLIGRQYYGITQKSTTEVPNGV